MEPKKYLKEHRLVKRLTVYPTFIESNPDWERVVGLEEDLMNRFIQLINERFMTDFTGVEPDTNTDQKFSIKSHNFIGL